MPLSAEITSVDTLQVRPAAEAFSGELAAGAAGDAAAAAASWADVPLNSIATIISVILLILYLGRLVHVFPYVFGSILRWKEAVNLEDSMGLIRDRGACAAVLVVPAALLASRYGLYAPDLINELPAWMQTLAVFAALLAYILLRRILTRAALPRKINHDLYQTADRAGYNFFIVAVLACGAAAGCLSLMGAEDLTIRNILYYILLFFFLVFLVRRTQILSNGCSQFTAFLYLCGLELFPAALLIASAILL